MLNVGKIEEGFVLDHIEAGQSLELYKHLGLADMDCTVAMIQNAKSSKMGRKDILKVECGIDELNMDVLAVINHNITVNVVKDGEIVEKIFILADEDKGIYRCKYCEEKVGKGDGSKKKNR